MKFWFAIVFLVLGEVAAAAEMPKVIRFASEEWGEATQKDGKGLYWEIFRDIYNPLGVEVQFQLVPYARATMMVEKQTVDAAPAYYIGDVQDVIYPNWHFDAELVMAIFKKNRIKNWKGPEAFSGQSVGWVRGYDFDKNLDVKVKLREIDKRKSGLKMLELDRIDFFLEAQIDLEDELKKGYLDVKKYRIEPVFHKKLYVIFANNKRGKGFSHHFDEQMPRLLRSGKLKKLFEKWNRSEFPF